MSELFDAVDALVASRSVLPPPGERKRLRAAHGLTIDEVATALKVRRATVSGWEAGKTEPRPPERDAYARLLDKLAELYPAPPISPAAPEKDTAVPEGSAGEPAPAPGVRTPAGAPVAEAAVVTAMENTQTPASAPAPVAVALESATPPVRTARPSSTSRRPVAREAAPAGSPVGGTDPRFANGPLAVVDVDDDGQVVAYCPGGLVLDVPAKSLPALVEWTLREAKLGAPKLSGPGKDADPLIVLTASALKRYGLPATLTDEERHAGRLPEDHKVIKQLVRAEWKLTKRGLGPWARIYRPATGSDRQCVQLCIPSWNALDPRSWGHAGQLPPADLARVLGVYAARVMTPRGSTAVTGLELMTALHPPTRASEPDADGRRHSEHNPGSLGKDPVDCAPCEAPDGHPLLADLPRFHVRGPGEKLFEEAYDWARPMTDDECTSRHLVGIDVNMAFAAGANGLAVGLGAPTHVKAPVFDAKLPGS
ncbi:helix-turn-helix domain-containing protein, partial [Streptomyces bobili]|uniref:telomere-associated protein Tap n=1 Tax=Streptomyces bobili TaxID=67280 RepID=UPI0033E3753D